VNDAAQQICESQVPLHSFRGQKVRLPRGFQRSHAKARDRKSKSKEVVLQTRRFEDDTAPFSRRLDLRQDVTLDIGEVQARKQDSDKAHADHRNTDGDPNGPSRNHATRAFLANGPQERPHTGSLRGIRSNTQKSLKVFNHTVRLPQAIPGQPCIVVRVRIGGLHG